LRFNYVSRKELAAVHPTTAHQQARIRRKYTRADREVLGRVN
jgi:hypothetical protein